MFISSRALSKKASDNSEVHRSFQHGSCLFSSVLRTEFAGGYSIFGTLWTPVPGQVIISGHYNNNNRGPVQCEYSLQLRHLVAKYLSFFCYALYTTDLVPIREKSILTGKGNQLVPLLTSEVSKCVEIYVHV